MDFSHRFSQINTEGIEKLYENLWLKSIYPPLQMHADEENITNIAIVIDAWERFFKATQPGA